MATPYYGMIEEVWVMLIDDDKEFVTHMTSLLKSHNYKVVCDEFNELVAKKTLEDGAYLYLKKPFDKEIVRYLWQFVLSEKIRREKARKGSGKHKYQIKFVDISTNNIVGENKEPEEKNVSYTKEQSNNIHEAGNDVVLSEKYTLQRKKGTKNMKENNEVERQNNVIDTVVRRKDYREWTEDLHARFMQVVRQLGEGRCYPKKILEEMNLPGLTRMQVASHLQNLGPPSANLPNEQGSEFDQVYSDDQNLGPPSANLPNEQDTEFDQVYSDD
ncbi:hypothetical protein KY290_035757 [Solanum tuberosum]|uniref:HTH myb-type domain-containing protein n=1 Tax=Solanum tuberosum TaxID=4113 RepID=A0ABQ7TQZ5_SOLTU|nr:hypothetical protein KY290_035757 [Solanum tuberosum]